jgi:hypothetical protein
MSMRITPVRRLAPIALLLAWTVAGCAGAAPEPAADAAPPVTAPPVNAPPVVAPVLGDPPPEQFCAALMAIAQRASQPSAPGDRAAFNAAVINGWAHIAEVAPAELKADALVMREGARQLTEGTLNSEATLLKIKASTQRFVRYTSEHCPRAALPRPGG